MAANQEPAQQLAKVLSQEKPISQGFAIALLVQLTKQVSNLHASGQIHREINADAIVLGPNDRVKLAAPKSEPVTCCRGDVWGNGPPELPADESLQIPSRLDSAQELLSKYRVPCDPIRIDLYQLGCLTVRLLLREDISQYLLSPQVRGRLPKHWRTVVDGALGHEPNVRFQNCGQLQAAIEAIASDVALGGSQKNTSLETLGKQFDDTIAKSGSMLSVATTGESFSKSSLPFGFLGPYRVDEKIGSGGMGDVYRGYDFQLNRTIAIKVLPRELARLGDFVGRFASEAMASSSLVHPNIVSTFQMSEDQGHHFFVMQYIEGESLADVLMRDQTVPADRGFEILEDVLAGLSEAHRNGLVHRDIKPSNILLEQKTGRALLADFGLVKALNSSFQATSAGVVMGTVDYISPEQGRGHEVDERSDLYAIGVLMYQMFSGTLPFEAEGPAPMIFQHAYEKPKPFQLAHSRAPASVVPLVDRLLQKNPSDRYQSAERLAQDIRAIRSGATLPKASFSVANAGSSSGIGRRERHKLAGLVAVCLLGVALWYFGSNDLEPSSLRPAQSTSLPARNTQPLVGKPVVIPYPSEIVQSEPGSVGHLTSDAWEWTTPINAGPAINSEWREDEPFLTDDGLAILFRSNRPGGLGKADLWMSQRDSNELPWEEAVNLGPNVNSEYVEGCPTMTADRLLLFFHAGRSPQGDLGDTDIFVSERTSREDPWGQARPLDAPVNSSYDDEYPYVTPDGLTLLFASRRPGIGLEDLWMCRRFARDQPWGDATIFSSRINSRHWDFTPKLGFGGRVFIFGSRREGGLSQLNDMWFAIRESLDQPFGNPINFGRPINTTYHETGAFLSSDGKTLWYTGLRLGGQGENDIWYSRRVLKKSMSPEAG